MKCFADISKNQDSLRTKIFRGNNERSQKETISKGFQKVMNTNKKYKVFKKQRKKNKNFNKKRKKFFSEKINKTLKSVRFEVGMLTIAFI